jgi:gliding motility-associated-like protein
VNAAAGAPAAPTASVTVQPTCAAPTGTIVITAPTGTGLSYSIDGVTYTNTTGTFTGLAPNNYNVTVRDAGGCTSAATVVTVNAAAGAPTAPTASVTVQPTCAANTGTIVITAPTGVGLTYSIDGVTYTNTTGTFTGLAAGTYNVTVRDAGGCTSAATVVTVNPPAGAPAAPTASVTVQPTCTTPTGTIVITAPTGVGLSYSIDGVTYTNTTGTFTGLAPNNYNVTVRDAGGCTSAATTLVVNGVPTAPAAPTASVTVQPTCATPTGTIVVTAPTGVGLTYSIDGVTYTNTTGTFTGLVPGTYNVTVRNAGGCTSAATSLLVNAAAGAPAAPTASVTIQPTCAAPTGTIVITAPTGAGLSYSIDGVTYTNTTGTFTGLVPNTYNVTVRDAGGCTSAATSLVVNAAAGAPAAPTASVTVQPTCITPTGTIVITAPTGVGLTYSIDGVTYTNTTGTFTGLAPNNYNVTVRDAGGCTSAATSLVVNAAAGAPAAPTASVTVQPTCATPTGTIVITAPTGVGLTYSIDGVTYTNTTGTFTGLAAGTYNLTVRDAGGCTSAATSLVVNAAAGAPAAPTASVTVQPTCALPTGTIVITAPLGAGLSYSIDGVTYTNTTGTFTGLAAGTYNVTVRDAGGCTSAATSLVVNAAAGAPAAPTASVTVQPTCATPTGSIVITAPTGAGLSYSIDGVTYTNTTGTFTGLAAGTYNLTVRDAGGCTSAATSLVVNAATGAPAAPAASVTVQPTCALPTATIVITAPTGAGLSYSIDGVTYTNTTGTFTGLAANTYNVTVRDAGGCTSAATVITVNAPAGVPAAPTASVTVQPTCATPTGTIVITAPLGVGLTYSIDGVTYTNTTGTFTGLLPGTYNVTVRDAGGCTSAATSLVVNVPAGAPAAPTASVTVQPTCAVPTGTIVITAPLGVGLTYSIDGVTYTNTTGTFTGLVAGTYNITVRDAGGCTSAATSLVVNAAAGAPAAPTASVTVQPTCAAPAGTIVITAPLGAGLSYSIDGVTYTNTTGTFTGLAAGTYNITVRDAGGCTSAATSLVVNAAAGAPALQITNPPAACIGTTVDLTNSGITAGSSSGLTFSYWINASATISLANPNAVATAGTYYIKAASAGGCFNIQPVTVTIISSPSLVITNPAPVCPPAAIDLTAASVTAGSSPGMAYSYWQDATGTVALTNPAAVTIAGTYYVKASAAGGCFTIKPVIADFNQPPTAAFKSDATICPGSKITLTITLTGKSPWTLTYSDGSNTYIVNTPTNSYDLIVNPASTTTYTIKSVADAACSNNTISSLATVTVTPPVEGMRYPTVSAVAFVPTKLSARGLGSNYSYVWSPGTGLDLPTIQEPEFKYGDSVQYIITLTSDLGCITHDSLFVKIILKPDIWVPKAWSPNNDGANDKLYPLTYHIITLKYFRIFDRWGQLMFETNVPGEGWDGMYHGQKQVMDIYTWTAEAVGDDGSSVKKSGNSILLR